jgi:hypothetical protein
MFVYRCYAFSRPRVWLCLAMAAAMSALAALTVFEYARYASMAELQQRASVLRAEYDHLSQHLVSSARAAGWSAGCTTTNNNYIAVLPLGETNIGPCHLPMQLRDQLRPPYSSMMVFRGLSLQPLATAWFVSAKPSPSAVAMPLAQLLAPLQQHSAYAVFNLVDAGNGRSLAQQARLLASPSPALVHGSGPIPLKFFDGSWRYFQTFTIGSLPGLVLVGSVPVADLLWRIMPLIVLSMIIALLVSVVFIYQLGKRERWLA